MKMVKIGHIQRTMGVEDIIVDADMITLLIARGIVHALQRASTKIPANDNVKE